MKKLLFIGIVALMVQSLGAVTLPSTSYSPYAGGSSSGTEQSLLSGGTMVTGSYSVLRLGDDDECTSMPSVPACQHCCEDKYFGDSGCCPHYDCDPAVLEGCLSSYEACADSCGSSLPLDGGLSILLILSLAGGAAKLLRNRRVNS